MIKAAPIEWIAALIILLRMGERFVILFHLFELKKMQ
jgi:hypothetical protein